VRPSCPGVDPAYLARFDADELSARQETPPVEADDITSLFVGAGELAPAVAPAAHSVTKARRALPMLGKVKPAVAEATPATERKTGEALKEIFPTLFEEPKG
jgi:hypothetical protein